MINWVYSYMVIVIKVAMVTKHVLLKAEKLQLAHSHFVNFSEYERKNQTETYK